MKRYSVILLLILSLFLTACQKETVGENTDNKTKEGTSMPKDFDIEFTYDVEGSFYFSSKEDIISNGFLVGSDDKRQVTNLELDDSKMEEIWSLIQKYDLLEYEENFTPQTQDTRPTRIAELIINYGNKVHTLKPGVLGLENDSDAPEKDKKYLEGLDSIYKLLTETEEYKSLSTDKIHMYE